MEKIKEWKQLALKDFVYVSWEYKGADTMPNRSEWLLGQVCKIHKSSDKYPAEVKCLACSSGAIAEVGKTIYLTSTALRHTNFDSDAPMSFRYKEFNKLTEGEAAIHLI